MNRRSRCIGTIVVRGIEWDVWLVSPKNKELSTQSTAWGSTNPDISRIYLNKDLRIDQLRVTLAHELVHVLLEQETDDAYSDEDFVRRLETPMMEILNQNPFDLLNKMKD